MKKLPLNALLLCLLATQALADYCQGDKFMEAIGIGKTPSEARGKAKAEIAGNIISHIKSETKITDSSKEKDGIIAEAGKFEATSIIESDLTLLGFQEAEAPKRQKNGSYELKVYICGRDAAKNFLERMRLLADSLDILSGTAHPKNKNEAWRKTQMLWSEYVKNRSIIEVLGVDNPYPAEEIYSKAVADYKKYCQNAKVFWQDGGNGCSEIVFSMLSKKIKMEKSRCSAGLKLSLSCSEKCTGSSMEIECSLNPALSIESCGGEKYSVLKANEVTASSPYNKSKARENLLENLSKADFFNEWEREIMEWVPKCD